jgi:hypothetical protein
MHENVIPVVYVSFLYDYKQCYWLYYVVGFGCFLKIIRLKIIEILWGKTTILQKNKKW